MGRWYNYSYDENFVKVMKRILKTKEEMETKEDRRRPKQFYTLRFEKGRLVLVPLHEE